MLKQPIINELKYFVTVVSDLYRSKPKEISLQLVRTSLTLLESLPAAREAVFEYISAVFDLSVERYAFFKDDNGIYIPPADEDAIAEIHEALENLVIKGPDAWAGLISTWSLRLLGRLSNRHSSRWKIDDIGDACKQWQKCVSIRSLLGLSALCFDKLDCDQTEQCISVMLSIFVQYYPHFDWVVARLGSCFPLKVISKILQCGLKGFSGNTNSTLDSEIGILGFLAFSHEKDLQFALKEMLDSSLNPQNYKETQNNPHTIPYLLHLCRKSDILLQTIISVFLDIFNENDASILNIMYQLKYWPPAYSVRELLPILTNLSTKINRNGTNIIMKLSTIADKYPWCHELLEYILYELENLILCGKSCVLFQDILRSDSKQTLWKACCSSNQIEHTTAVRLILLVSSNKNQLIYHQTIAELLTKPLLMNSTALGCLIRLLGGSNGSVDVPSVETGVELALETFFMVQKRRQSERDEIGFNILNNLLIIVRLEKKGTCPNLKRLLISKSCLRYISKLLNIFALLMHRATKTLDTDKCYVESSEISELSTQGASGNATLKKPKIEVEEEGMIVDDDDDVQVDSFSDTELLKREIHVLVKLLDGLVLIGADNIPILDTGNVLKLAKLVVKYFFWNLTERNTITRLIAIGHVNSILSQHCQNKTARAVAMLDLLEGSLFTYSNLFGARCDGNETINHVGTKPENRRLLMQLNQKMEKTPNSNRSILHAGIIGNGPRKALQVTKLPDTEVQNLLLSVLTACCKDEKYANTITGFNTISLLLVEMVSPDVMYNGLPWLEDDFLKVTMERDLQIQRTFHNSPILWSILELVATYRPALCFTSVLFRAVCATVLHKWQAKSFEKTANLLNSELMFTTVKLLEIMSLGQFISPPLNYFHFVIQHFDPNEIAIVLKECIWNYMKENVPSPLPFARDANGFQWREPNKVKNRKDDILRNMMERKLAQLGHYYYIMFVMPEQYESQQNQIQQQQQPILIDDTISSPNEIPTIVI